MKILQLIDAFNPGNYGGAGKVFIETSKQLVCLGDEIDVICRTEEVDECNKYEGINFYTYNNILGSSLKKLLYYRQNLKILLKDYLKVNSPDALIFHSSTAVIGLDKFLRTLKIPKIYYFHSPWHKEYEVSVLAGHKLLFNIPASLLRKNHEFTYLNVSDGVVTLSESMRKEMLLSHTTIHLKPYRILSGAADSKVFYPPKDDKEKLEIREKLHLDKEGTYIIVSRRLIERTGIDILLQGFKLMFDKYSEKNNLKKIKLIITGRGNKEKFFKKLAGELQLDNNVIFTGYVLEKELADYYRASDLFVIPTKFLEGFGLATVEAMASGLPVIGTAVGGTEEILTQLDEKLLIQSISSEAMADKIYFMLNQDLSEWGKKALKFYNENFSWNKHSRDLRSFISEINNFY